jgi:hypothetical protein
METKATGQAVGRVGFGPGSGSRETCNPIRGMTIKYRDGGRGADFRLIPRTAAPSLRAVIRFLLTTLTVLCLRAGQGARAALADGCCAGEPDDNCHQTHLAVSAPAGGHQPGDDCPVDHHCHHGCCTHGQSLEVGNPLAIRVGMPNDMSLGLRHEDEALPEAPFLSGEKPPLI